MPIFSRRKVGVGIDDVTSVQRKLRGRCEARCERPVHSLAQNARPMWPPGARSARRTAPAPLRLGVLAGRPAPRAPRRRYRRPRVGVRPAGDAAGLVVPPLSAALRAPARRAVRQAWLATLIPVALPVRTAAAALLWRWLPPETEPLPRPRLLHAASRWRYGGRFLLLFLLAMVVLKRELDERGLRLTRRNTPAIATFLGVIVSRAIAPAADARRPTGTSYAVSAPPPAAAPPLPLPPSAPRPPVLLARASLVVDTLEGGAAAPWRPPSPSALLASRRPSAWWMRRLATRCGPAARARASARWRCPLVAFRRSTDVAALRRAPRRWWRWSRWRRAAERRGAPRAALRGRPSRVCDDDAAAATATATTVELGGRLTIFAVARLPHSVRAGGVSVGCTPRRRARHRRRRRRLSAQVCRHAVRGARQRARVLRRSCPSRSFCRRPDEPSRRRRRRAARPRRRVVDRRARPRARPRAAARRLRCLRSSRSRCSRAASTWCS